MGSGNKFKWEDDFIALIPGLIEDGYRQGDIRPFP